MNEQKVKKAKSDAEQPAANPFEKTIPISIVIHTMGETRKVKSGKVEVNADKSMVNVNKKIFACPEYSAIGSLAGKIRAYMYRKRVPGGELLFRHGTYPIPVSMLEDIDDKMEQFVEQFKLLVTKFCKVYEARKAEAMTRLRDLADARDYPPIEYVRAQFGIEYQYVSFGPPQALEGFNKDLYRREVVKVREAAQRAVESVQAALRGMLQDLLAHMVERLKPGDDGKKKIFKDSLIGNVKEFLADFRDRNITGDREMEALVEQCERILKGKSPDLLRRDDFTRTETAKALEEVKKVVDGMVAVAPTRKIFLDD